MDFRIHRVAFAVIVTSLAAFACAGAASASPGSGAQHIQTHECFPVPDLYTFCVDQSILTNTTETATTVSSVIHSDTVNTFTGDPTGLYAGCNETSTGSYDETVLSRKDEIAVFRYKYQNVDVVVNCFGVPSYTCTTVNTFHYANGQVQYYRPEAFCTPL
jgi:hypothetical protein